jgi:hypothetical protein
MALRARDDPQGPHSVPDLLPLPALAAPRKSDGGDVDDGKVGDDGVDARLTGERQIAILVDRGRSNVRGREPLGGDAGYRVGDQRMPSESSTFLAGRDHSASRLPPMPTAWPAFPAAESDARNDMDQPPLRRDEAHLLVVDGSSLPAAGARPASRVCARRSKSGAAERKTVVTGRD